MPSEFSSNVREIAREIKGYDKRTATAIRKAMRVAVAEAGAGTLAAIKEAASFSKGGVDGMGQPRAAIPDVTKLRLTVGLRSNGARITVDSKRAPQARALEGSAGRRRDPRNRHPVFANKDKSRNEWRWVDQPTKPYFFDAAKAQAPVDERELIAAVDVAIREAGWAGI